MPDRSTKSVARGTTSNTQQSLTLHSLSEQVATRGLNKSYGLVLSPFQANCKAQRHVGVVATAAAASMHAQQQQQQVH